MIANQDHYFTPDEYLKWEPQQEIKYEYVDGEVLAMTGGTIPHNDIALNIATALKAYLRGKKCKTSMADAKLGITENGPFHYPDVMVSCDERDRHATKFIQHPCLIVEVLSESTAAYDRGDEFKKYRRIKTLQEYVLIEQDTVTIDRYKLNEHGIWELHSYEQGDEIHLDSVDFSFPISLLYEDVEIPE